MIYCAYYLENELWDIYYTNRYLRNKLVVIVTCIHIIKFLIYIQRRKVRSAITVISINVHFYKFSEIRQFFIFELLTTIKNI